MLELGAELISSDIIAFYELIKNGFDAGTTRGVDVRFDIAIPRHAYLKLQEGLGRGGALEHHRQAVSDAILPGVSDAARHGILEAIAPARTAGEMSAALAEAQARHNTITVADRGSGMSMTDLERNFLVIGTASRKREVDAALAAGATASPFLGEKGIGRLSAMRLGERLRVETARAGDSAFNLLNIDWRAFADIDAMLDQVPVEPEPGGPKPSADWSGTSIVISDLLENWTPQRVREMCDYDFARLTDPFADAATRPRVAIHWNGDRLTIPMMPTSLLTAAHAKVDAYLAARHQLVSLDGGFDGVVDKALRELGRERRVVATVPYFLAGLAALGGGEDLLTVPRGFAARYADAFGLHLMEPPLPLQPFEMCAVRRGGAAPEPLAAVVVDALVEIGRELEGGGGSNLPIRHGCGRMQDLEPQNDFERA